MSARDGTDGTGGTPPVVSGSEEPLAEAITVVVASRDRRGELLASLARHEAPVVLVDNASTDGSAPAVRAAFPDVDVVGLGRNLGAAARTIGVARAGTRYVAFADDDSWWAPGALGRAVAVMDAHPRAALVHARILLGSDERLEPLCEQLASAPLGVEEDLPGPSIAGFAACGAVVRAQAFTRAGGFDDVVVFPGEEERLSLDLLAAGWGMAYVPELVVHHHPSPARSSPEARRAAITRSLVLTALMRRPWPVVARRVRAALADGRAGRTGLARAVRSVPAALAARRRLPAAVEALAEEMHP